MKKIFTFVLMIGFAAVLGAQSLADLAKSEKARRTNLGDRRVPVVTNADILRVKKKSGVETAAPGKNPGQLEPRPAAIQGQAPPRAQPAAPTAPLKAGEPSLEEQLKAAEELASLLEIKIAKLKQDYSAQESMVPNYVIEQQLTETLQRFQNAQAEAARLRKEIDQKGSARKKGPKS